MSLSAVTHFAVALFLVSGTVGVAVLLRAGRDYVRGDLDGARRSGRKGAWLLGVGNIVLAAFVVSAWLSGMALPGPTALPGAILALAAGFAGLLGGLSGKPRPAGEIAALLHFAAILCVALAA
jgi:hypothetical protein